MLAPIVSTATALRREIRAGLWVDSRLAIWLEQERVLAVADLHWGYSASHRSRGNLLPYWGDDDIEARLRTLVADYAPDEMVWVGDVIHAAEGASRADAFLRAAGVRVTILAGNHDRRWTLATQTSAQRGPYFFHHGDIARPVPLGCVEVIGHFHPAFAWYDGAGGRVKLPALVSRRDRLILPAFSPWASGVEWPADGDTTLWAISPKRIFAVASSNPTSVAP